MNGLTRRGAVWAGAAAATAAAWPAGAGAADPPGEELHKELRKLKFGPHGELVPNAPENQKLLGALKQAPLLKPQELLAIAAHLRMSPATEATGLHLGCCAFQTIFASAAVQKALGTVGKTKIEFSVIEDLFCPIAHFLGINWPPCTHRIHCQFEHKCEWFITWERRKCEGDRDWSGWYFVGFCWPF